MPKESLKSLLTGLIDYAGIFPPAKLPLTEAFPKYVQYIKGQNGWMMSRFIISAALLPELSKIIESENIDIKEVCISVTGRGGNTVSEHFEGLSEDFKYILDFHKKYGSKYIIDMFELKIPEKLFEENDSVKYYEFFDKTEYYISTEFKSPYKIFFEGSFKINPAETLEKSIECIRTFNDNNKPAGYKMRTGGINAVDFPSAELVAHALKLCKDNFIAFKATAGLHHPVKHFNNGMKTSMHGFLNIFIAAVLLDYLTIDESEVLKIISEENPSAFIFDEEQLCWGKHCIPTGKITLARKEFSISYGSCSFDEPIEDLQKIGLL